MIDEVFVIVRTFMRCSCWGENNGNNEAVKSDSLGEDHQKNDGDQDVVVLDSLDTSFTGDTDGETWGKSGKSDAKPSSEMLVPLEVVVVPVSGVRNASNIGGLNYFTKFISMQREGL